MSLKLGSNDTAILAGSSVVKQMLLGTSPKFAAPILDHVPNAAAAYSLRRLSNAFTGPVVKVRRSSDSTLADFTADEVVDGTLAAWCGAGDGFVDTWYDQSGNARNATQATAGYQPKLVSSGVVVTEGGKPALLFDGVDDRVATSAFSSALTSQSTSAAVCRLSSLTADNYFVHDGINSSNRRIAGYNITYGWYAYMGLDVGPLVANDATQHVLFCKFDATQSDLHLDGYLAKSAYVGSNSLTGLTVGSRWDQVDHFWKGTISELIVYPSDVSASRELAEGEMAWHYGIQSKLPYNHPYAPQAIGGGSQTVPTDSDVLAFAAASGAKSIPDLNKIEDLVAYLKAQSLWDYARFYPMKSAQNAGSGSTVYGLGGLTSNNMTLVNSPTWGSDGVTFDGSTQYGKTDVAGLGIADEALILFRSSPSLASAADAARAIYVGAGGNRTYGSGTGGFISGVATGLTSGETWSSDWTFAADTSASGRRVGTSLLAWSAGEDHTTAFQVGNSSALWKNKTAISLDKNNVIDGTNASGPSDIGLSPDKVFVSGYLFNGSETAGNTSGIAAVLMILASSSQPTTTQRETITDLINAL